ncbi:MAG: glycosyltransferase family 1 protein [Bacteroidales bacterium]|nr:glycosyltransferase family 1 protein [Bacteroidales bacterium]
MRVHVVSFQVPYPADYGGVIDVFYKLKALHDEGYEIILHTFRYNGREPAPILEELCSEVHYYERRKGLFFQLFLTPYIVKTRNARTLLKDLCKDDAPILFEGVHTCFFINHPALKGRKKVVRMHNIEHDYYKLLAQQTPSLWKSLYYRVESRKLDRFEEKLEYADTICAISASDELNLKIRFPENNVVLLPAFFDIPVTHAEYDTEPFVLYHGNLAVEENAHVAHFIAKEVAPLLPEVKFVIAGHEPNLSDTPENVSVISSPSDKQLDELIATARINLLLTFQPTGLKLKLINTLVKSNGFIIANKDMLTGHSLGEYCIQADTPSEIANAIQKAMRSEPDLNMVQKRNARISEVAETGISILHKVLE